MGINKLSCPVFILVLCFVLASCKDSGSGGLAMAKNQDVEMQVESVSASRYSENIKVDSSRDKKPFLVGASFCTAGFPSRFTILRNQTQTQ